MKMLTTQQYEELIADSRECNRLRKLINTPELVDFPKAVLLESVHLEVRWGTPDREGKKPYDWHWLVAHLSGRALEHHKEADRLHAENVECGEGSELVTQINQKHIAYHREKAVHHCITAAAAMSHWHASMLGKHTSMQAGHSPAIAETAGAA